MIRNKWGHFISMGGEELQGSEVDLKLKCQTFNDSSEKKSSLAHQKVHRIAEVIPGYFNSFWGMA